MSDEILDYLKSLNPQEGDKAILIYDASYRLWRDGKYLGKAIWTKDENIGDSFQTISINKNGDENANVFVADKWELIINKK